MNQENNDQLSDGQTKNTVSTADASNSSESILRRTGTRFIYALAPDEKAIFFCGSDRVCKAMIIAPDRPYKIIPLYVMKITTEKIDDEK